MFSVINKLRRNDPKAIALRQLCKRHLAILLKVLRIISMIVDMPLLEKAIELEPR
jgi:hypothetical protein